MASQVAEQIKTLDLKKLGTIWKVSTVHGMIA